VDPAHAVLVDPALIGPFSSALAERTKFCVERLDVEPSNLQSVLAMLRTKLETSVPTFFITRITGPLSAAMFEKFLASARRCSAIKIVVVGEDGVGRLWSRLPTAS
jgi:hypothetical protein